MNAHLSIYWAELCTFLALANAMLTSLSNASRFYHTLAAQHTCALHQLEEQLKLKLERNTQQSRARGRHC